MDEIWNLDQKTLKILLNDLKSSENISSKENLPIPKAKPRPRPKRCEEADCKTKLALTDSACKCTGFYCIKHRHAETHSCAFDYKSEGINKLKAQLPEVRAVKLENI